MEDLPFYPPGQLMINASKLKFNNESLKAVNPQFGKYLQTLNLDYDNMTAILETLLRIEDITTMQCYAKLMKGEKILINFNNEDTSVIECEVKLSAKEVNAEDILAPGIDEVVLVSKGSLMASPWPIDIILAQLPHAHEALKLGDPMRRFVGLVKKVKRTSVVLEFSKRVATFLYDRKFHFIFRSGRVPLRLMYAALRLLQADAATRRYLFPNRQQLNAPAATLPKFPLFNQTIAANNEQLQAVQQIVAGPSTLAPYILFGPPGTGKTTTLVEAILQLHLNPKNRILVACGSNSACDTIALRLCEYFEQLLLNATDAKPLVRLYSKLRVKKGLKEVPPLLLRYANVERSRCELDRKLKLAYKTLKSVVTKINVATLCTAQVLKLQVPDISFTHIFIDEAAAATEPEALLAIVGLKGPSTHVILSGDHKQLGAVIKSQRAASLGLGHSLMERLLYHELYALNAQGSYEQRLQTRLRRNYRSHPAIVGVYNQLYYNGELLAQVTQAASCALLPNPQSPVLFHSVHGCVARAAHSASSYNELEAHVVLWYIQQLLRRGLDPQTKVAQRDIGVVSPYLAQCRLIELKLRQLGIRRLEVGSVESYQGREKPIIIVSLVSSFNHISSFVANPRRINVLLSRAKSLLILVGNPTTLSTVNDFKFIIDYCKLAGNLNSQKSQKSKSKKKLAKAEPELKALSNNVKKLSLNN
ncbi:maker59 [Drosophila busckii]|uniref:Maker59 n=1 Tax=Drosophila busckii TaxID=30019 RepID=A0A0M4EG58_DROBS|nr:putative helicase MOV-10 [Drosophila busckii]ALC41335.1 maker59 [Drosophila busckii]